MLFLNDYSLQRKVAVIIPCQQIMRERQMVTYLFIDGQVISVPSTYAPHTQQSKSYFRPAVLIFPITTVTDGQSMPCEPEEEKAYENKTKDE